MLSITNAHHHPHFIPLSWLAPHQSLQEVLLVLWLGAVGGVTVRVEVDTDGGVEDGKVVLAAGQKHVRHDLCRLSGRLPADRLKH